MLQNRFHTCQDNDGLVDLEYNLTNAAYFIVSFGSCNWDSDSAGASNFSKINHWKRVFKINDNEEPISLDEMNLCFRIRDYSSWSVMGRCFFIN